MQLTELQKFEIIIKYNEGLSIRKIATLMQINKCTVNMWILRYKNDKNLNKKQRCGNIIKNINNQ